MPKFYFTFGMNHSNKEGFSLCNNFVVIEAENEGIARDKMVAARGPKWSFSYPEELFGYQAEKYNLTQLTLEQVTIV